MMQVNTDHAERQFERVTRAIAQQTFCTAATTSSKNRPHVAGVIYEAVDTTLYVHTLRTSRKARNVAANPRVAVCIPVRKLPVGPPFTIQFQATAETIEMTDPSVVHLLNAGKLKGISGHGALDEPDGCFLRITPSRTIITCGLGVPMLGIIRDPLHAGARRVALV